MRGRSAALVAVVGLALAGCSGTQSVPAERTAAEPRPTPLWQQRTEPSTSPTPWTSPTPRRVVAQAVSRSSLVAFDDCADLLARMKREALAQVGPWGLPYGGYGGFAVATRVAAAPAAAGTAAGAAAGTSDYSGTNNQEAGVEEADQVKTDGRLLLALRHQPLGVQVVDVSGEVPRLRGFFPLKDGMWDAQLLLVGGRLVVLGDASTSQGEHFSQRTAAIVVSLADPDAPRVERTFTVNGTLSAAREVGGRVLLVTQSSPQVAWSYPADDTVAERLAATLKNRNVIRSSTLDTWLPSVRSSTTGQLHRASCNRAMHAQTASGTATTAVLSLDPASDVPGEQVTVAGSSAVVYASTSSVYVTTWSWEAQAATSAPDPDQQDTTTSVHRFDIADPSRPSYAGSGSVPGTLVGQYALSEHEGHLRVASTLGRTWAAQGEDAPPSDNLVTVLRLTADGLVTVGRVRGLGRGERIYGVRFLGDLGYVVTFRQTDPLYVLDLSNPEHPARRGDLHVTGYSSYLHPLAPGLLLGIGQEVAANRAQGTQLSTFEVSDPRAPALRSRKTYDSAWSTAEHDPHAVLWWPATRMVVVPLQQSSDDSDGQMWEGAVVLSVRADGTLRQRGRIAHPDDTPEGSGRPVGCCWGGILRSVVVGDSLLTLSERGVLTVSVDTLEARQWSPYR